MNKFLGFLLFFVFASADAALTDRGGGFIYDDVLDITWTQNANINGLDTWANQAAWAAGLGIVDTRPGAGSVTYSDWRLPIMDVNGDNAIVDCSSTTELACRDNEYGYLFYQDGVTAVTPGLFTNVQAEWYWAGTEYALDTGFAWSVNLIGGQGVGPKSIDHYAWAVRTGDVAAVPVPAAVWLFGTALLGLLGVRRARR